VNIREYFGIKKIKTIPNVKISEGVLRWSLFKPLDSKCFLRLYSNQGRIIALVQQLPIHSGCSISNGAEEIATLVFGICQKEVGLKLVNDFQFIRFYPKEVNTILEDNYALVHFDWDGKKFSNPEWERISYEIVGLLTGEHVPYSQQQEDQFIELSKKN
jgi:hypothetical protein